MSFTKKASGSSVTQFWHNSTPSMRIAASAVIALVIACCLYCAWHWCGGASRQKHQSTEEDEDKWDKWDKWGKCVHPHTPRSCAPSKGTTPSTLPIPILPAKQTCNDKRGQRNARVVPRPTKVDSQQIRHASAPPKVQETEISTSTSHIRRLTEKVAVLGPLGMAPWGIGYIEDDSTQPAQWIWNTPDAATKAISGQPIRFQKKFTVPEDCSVEFATMVDDGAVLYFNGVNVGKYGGGWKLSDTDATAFTLPCLAGVENVLEIVCINNGGPAGLIGSMRVLVENVDGGIQTDDKSLLRTDDSWTWALEEQ